MIGKYTNLRGSESEGRIVVLQEYTMNMWILSRESQETPLLSCVLSEFIVFFSDEIEITSDESEITSDELKIISDKI